MRTAAVVLSLVLAGCTAPEAEPAAPASPSASASPASPSASPASPTASASAAPSPASSPARFRASAAFADVRALAVDIGPRLATSPAYRRAGRFVERRLRGLGYDVTRQGFRVPAGDSWGVPVEAGRSFNVIAAPPGFDATRPHLVVGAHLDTVAVAPGAEDNASGVAVLLELARLAAKERTRLPVVFIAFGAEEPVGSGDALHHFGSQRYVARLSANELGAVQAMLSLDRVGVGTVVPVCTGPLSPDRVQDELVRAGRRVGVPTQRCENTASDHWSFEKAGVAVARLGSTPYAAYHSAADLPRVVDRAQLARTGNLAWEWLRQRS